MPSRCCARIQAWRKHKSLSFMESGRVAEEAKYLIDGFGIMDLLLAIEEREIDTSLQHCVELERRRREAWKNKHKGLWAR